MTNPRDIKLLAIIFLVALMARVTFLLVFPEIEHPNFQYDTIGWNLARGHGYSMDPEPPYVPSAYRPPVYPFMLAAVYTIFGHSYETVKGVQAILGALTCILIYFIGFEVFDRRTGIIASLASAVYPAFLFYVNMLIMEVVLIFLVAITVYLFVKAVKRKTIVYQIAFGASIGLTSLCRPVMLLFPFFAIGVILYVYRDKMLALKHFSIMFTATVIVLTPWTIRNYVEFGEILPVVAKGMGSQLWGGKYLLKEGLIDFKGEVRKEFYTMRDSLTAGLGPIEAEKKLFRLGVHDILDDPLAYSKNIILKIVKLWKHPIGATRTLPRYSQALANLQIIFYYVMLILALLGMLRLGKRLVPALPLMTTILYFTLVHGMLHAINRYRVPILPYVIIFASFSVANGWHSLKPYIADWLNRRRR